MLFKFNYAIKELKMKRDLIRRREVILPAEANPRRAARKSSLVRFGPLTLQGDKREWEVHLTGHKEKSSLRSTDPSLKGVYEGKRGFEALAKGTEQKGYSRLERRAIGDHLRGRRRLIFGPREGLVAE